MPKFKIGQLVKVRNENLDAEITGNVINCDEETVVINASYWTESWIVFKSVESVENVAEGAAQPDEQAEKT